MKYTDRAGTAVEFRATTQQNLPRGYNRQLQELDILEGCVCSSDLPRVHSCRSLLCMYDLGVRLVIHNKGDVQSRW
jgi:hypothetical protein